MAQRGTNTLFLTPDRRPIPDSSTKGFSTTADRTIFKKIPSQRSQQFAPTEINRQIFRGQQSNSDKQSRLQERVMKLRVYLNESPKIEKRKIRQIFDWNDKLDPQHSEEKRLLKELGSKVRGLIKQNSNLKNTIYSGEISDMRLENQRLKSLLETIHQGESVRNKIILQENQLLKNYIESSGKKGSHRGSFGTSNQIQRPQLVKEVKEDVQEVNQDVQQEAKQEIRQEEVVKPKEPLFNEHLLSLERLENLKNSFSNSINNKIEENDEKLALQQKYIDTLEQRIAQLQKIEGKLDHLKFQKKVKLTQSARKSKNFTANAPKVIGETLQNELAQQIDQRQQQQKKVQLVKPINYYSKKERITQNIGQKSQLQNQLYRLNDENALLKLDYQQLKEKYEVEILKHIHDISQRELMLIQINRLTAQNKLLTERFHRLAAS